MSVGLTQGYARIVDSAGANITIGQKTAASSLPVVVASDQAALSVKLQDGSGQVITSSGGALNINSPDSSASGSISGVSQSVIISCPGGDATWDVVLTGTWAGTMAFEASFNGVQYFATNGTNRTLTTGVVIQSTTSNGVYFGNTSGATNIRVSSSAWTSGTATVNMRISSGGAVTNIINALPQGSNIIGKVTTDQTTHGTTDLVAADLTKVGGSALTIGQKAMAASLPVVIASDQSSVGVTQSTSPWVDNLTQVGGSAITLGSKVSASSLPVVVASDQANIKVNLYDGSGNAITSSLSAASNPISLNINSPDSSASGNIINTNDVLALTDPGGDSTWTVTITGTWSGTIAFDATSDNSNWKQIYGIQVDSNNPTQVNQTTANGTFKFSSSGFVAVRVRGSTMSSGTATINMRLTSGVGVVALGTSLPTGSNLIGKVGFDQTTPGTTNAISIAQIGATTVVTGGKVGVLATGGTDAVNVAPTANPNYVAGLGQSSEPAANTTSRITALFTDLYGKLITSPYAGRDNFVKGTATTTGTGDTSVVASAGGSLRNYITNISVANTGSAATLITIKDGSGGSTLWYTIAPSGSGSNITLPVPIPGTAATAVYFAAGSASTTVYCAMAGYKGA